MQGLSIVDPLHQTNARSERHNVVRPHLQPPATAATATARVSRVCIVALSREQHVDECKELLHDCVLSEVV